MVSSGTLKVSILEDDEVKDHMPLSISVVVTLTEHALKISSEENNEKLYQGFKEKIDIKEEKVVE